VLYWCKFHTPPPLGNHVTSFKCDVILSWLIDTERKNGRELRRTKKPRFSGREIKDLTPVRGQDGKISDTQGKDFWSPTRLRHLILFLTNILLKVQYFPSWETPYMKYDVTHILTSLKNDVKGTDQGHLEIRKKWK
jgi:hypothetical protein